MNKVRILSDSVCDMQRNEMKETDIEIIPLYINFNGESYLDGVELDAPKLFELMDKHKGFPTTSQVTPQRFIEVFKKYIDAGEDIVLFTMSSKLSGTHQSALIAKDNFPEGRIFVIDTLNVTCGQYVLLKYGIKLRNEGKSAKEIFDLVTDAVPRMKVNVAFDTLSNLVRSGRIGKAAGFVGGMLGIKPIISVVDGFLKPVAKERGTKKAISYIIESLKKEKPQKGTEVVVGHCLDEEYTEPIKAYLKEAGIPFTTMHVGGVTAAHIGPNAFGYFLIGEK